MRAKYSLAVYSSDGGLDVLRSLFSRSDTTLTKVTLRNCDFGTAEEASRLLSSFETNRTVTDLFIGPIENLEGVALGNCISGLMQNMSQLQRLTLLYSDFVGENDVRAFQPALQVNRTLRELSLACCYIGNNGLRLIADALVGNSTMQVFNIRHNFITSNCLPDIIRIIESTRLQKIDMIKNRNVFDNDNFNLQFAAKLYKNTTIQGLEADWAIHGRELEKTVNITCARNKSLAYVAFLLAPTPPPLPQQQPLPQSITGSSTSLFLLKTWHKAIVKFARDGPSGGNAGASAIFKLFTARPQLLEKRLKRPVSAAAAVSQKEQKRRRL